MRYLSALSCLTTLKKYLIQPILHLAFFSFKMAAKVRESSFCDKQQNDAIIRALFQQKDSATFCDVIMKVCGRDIHAHSSILAAASPYFNTFLRQDLPRQFSQRSPQVSKVTPGGGAVQHFSRGRQVRSVCSRAQLQALVSRVLYPSRIVTLPGRFWRLGPCFCIVFLKNWHTSSSSICLDIFGKKMKNSDPNPLNCWSSGKGKTVREG